MCCNMINCATMWNVKCEMWNASSSDASAQQAARKKISPKQVFVNVLELCVLFSLFRRLELCNYVCRPQSPCWPQTTILSHNLNRVTVSNPFCCVSQFRVLEKVAKQLTHFCCVSLCFTVFWLCFTVCYVSKVSKAPLFRRPWPVRLVDSEQKKMEPTAQMH